jgi:hypothetical protein
MWLGEPYILEAGIAALAKDGITVVRLQATRGTASGGPCRRGAGKLEGDDSGRHQQVFRDRRSPHSTLSRRERDCDQQEADMTYFCRVSHQLRG